MIKKFKSWWVEHNIEFWTSRTQYNGSTFEHKRFEF